MAVDGGCPEQVDSPVEAPGAGVQPLVELDAASLLEQVDHGLRVGAERQSGSGIDEEQIQTFARQFDPQPFHLDAEAAKLTLFGGLVASGWHTAAVTMRLLVQGGMPVTGGIVGAGAEISWPRPTRPGDVLSVESEVVVLAIGEQRIRLHTAWVGEEKVGAATIAERVQHDARQVVTIGGFTARQAGAQLLGLAVLAMEHGVEGRSIVHQPGARGLRYRDTISRLTLYEWTHRRAQRRVDARVQLRSAHDILATCGLAGFAERAARELGATGETLRTRTHHAHDQLTDQEQNVARLAREGLPHGADDWMFVNTAGRFVNPESLSQLFDRLQRTMPDLTRIRFHDLRHTHASLLIMDGVPVKVVSERLGHANVAFTIHTYQHLLPGMSAAAAQQFAALLAAHTR